MNRASRSLTAHHRRARWFALGLLLLSPALGESATPEEVLAGAIQKLLAPGEGQVSEGVFAAPGGVTSEAELQAVARIRYTFKAPRCRAEVTDLASQQVRVLVQDGREAWLVTQVGATRLAEVAPDVRRALTDQAFPFGFVASSVRLAGSEAGGSVQVLEGVGADGPWIMWVRTADGRLVRYRLRGGEALGDLFYEGGGILRKVTLRNGQGRLVLARFRDRPAKVAVEDAVFNIDPAKGGGDLGRSLAHGLTSGRTQGSAITATAGARGVDEEVQQRQLGQMRLDYQAAGEMERFRVADALIEDFLRAGRLGRYRE